MGLFSKKKPKSENSSEQLAFGYSLDSPEWAKSAIEFFTFEVPALEGIDLVLLTQIIRDAISQGHTESTVTKLIVSKLGASKDLAKFLSRALLRFAMSSNSFNSYAGQGVEKIEWIGGGCCPPCDANHGIQVKPGENFPSGHRFPPACLDCICSLAPVIDYGEELSDEAFAAGLMRGFKKRK